MIDAVYHHIDSDYEYKNEEQVRLAIWSKIEHDIVKTEDLILTPKVLLI